MIAVGGFAKGPFFWEIDENIAARDQPGSNLNINKNTAENKALAHMATPGLKHETNLI